MAMTLTAALRSEYDQLFENCEIRANRLPAVEQIVNAILRNRLRYETAAAPHGAPWYFVGAVHNLESSLSFTKHLHNGDALTRRTVRVPAGRPRSGNPPFSWEESAQDALGMKNLNRVTDWSVGSTLFQLERYNGFGYRLRATNVLSPYLWSFSTHYSKGKFVSDGVFSATAGSSQCGAAVILRRLAERGETSFPDQPVLQDGAPPLVRFSRSKPSDPDDLERVMNLQRFLNTHPGIFLRVDGIAATRTSDAVMAVLGRFLPGDPRA